uniref:Replication associated protein n=2 Tax=unclassified Gemykolovirus TaxID=2763233 RepID=A0AAU6S5B5_9VIRU
MWRRLPIMPRKFKITEEQFFMLTYPKTPTGWTCDNLVTTLDGLGCDYRIGRELHQDGSPHYHAMLVFAEPYSDDDARITFTCDGRTPNIKMRRAKPQNGWDYVGKHAGTKEGHEIVAERGMRPGGEDDGTERPSNDVWHEIILARTREEFFDSAARLAPRQLACSFSQLTAYADWKYRVAEKLYETPVGNFEVPIELQRWANENLEGLVLFGATRLGKTVWARSLGRHYYTAGLWDLAGFDESVEYAIFDDMVNGLRAGYFKYKDWMGGQFNFTVQDKYAKKKRVNWGKAAIYITNVDPRLDANAGDIEWDWMEENCTFYEVREPIFRANIE